MQPQESGFDWWHAAAGAAGAIIGAVSTLFGWIIRAARMGPTIRAEMNRTTAAAEERIQGKISEAERRSSARIDQEVGNFRETLLGMRQKIDDVEKDAVSKESFNEFRREHREDFQQLRKESREDFAKLEDNIVELLKARHDGK